MKILFVSQYFYPETFKGNDIVFYLKDKGYDITVLTGKPNYPGGKFYKGYNFLNKNTEYIKGVKVIRVPVFPRMNGKTFPLLLNYSSFVFFSFLFSYRFKDNYDLVFVQQLSPVTMALPGLWIKKRKKIPLVLWVLDLWPESVVASTNIRNKLLIKPIEKLVEKIYRNSDIILISSKSFKKSIIDRCNCNNKHISYFPNWAEDVFTKSMLNSSVITQIPKIPKGFNIMFAGNIGEAQDMESILKAAELTRDKKINWLIVGDGRKLEWVKNEIKKRTISNVFLLGRYPLEMMPTLFKKANVMLVSLKDKPIFSLTVPAKIQSYMASGKIILGMLNGEGRDLINNSRCGYSVNAGDYYGLASLVLKVSILKSDEIQNIERISLKYYQKNFSKDKLLLNLESFLINLHKKKL